MKILFTSIGRRVELVQAFRNAAEKLGVDMIIYGADITESAPALFFCDEYVEVPRINDPLYIENLKNISKSEHIDAIIPTIDTDLLLLANHKDEFGDTKVIISSPEKISICRDKNYTSDYFISLGLNSPKAISDCSKYNLGYPAFIKPKDGSSSIFAYKVSSEEELKQFAERVPDYVIQPFIDGTEYTIDAFCDFDGNPILITPRIRLAVRAGEVLKTKISQDDTIIEEMKKIISDFKPCGQITVQLIREKQTGKDYYIEINPRFGGGAPLSIKAGADSAEMLIKLIRGERLSYIEKAAEDGAVYSRFDQSVRVE